MLRNIVEINEEGRYLSASRGSLIISIKKDEIARVPLDDIAVLMITAQGTSLSKELMVRIGERGGVVILCGSNYLPASYILPKNAHFDYTGRLYDQLESSMPLRKQLWKTVIKAKIKNQARVLSLYKKREYRNLLHIAETITSGDKENREAHAARVYWKSLFAGAFKRDSNEPGINHLLNYGYGVLRGTVARAVCRTGLEPALGIHHRTRTNPMCLVDDLVEPYRPLFDIAAVELSKSDPVELNPSTKKKIVSMSHLDFESERGRTPFIVVMEGVALSLVESFRQKKNLLTIPLLPDETTLSEMTQTCF